MTLEPAGSVYRILDRYAYILIVILLCLNLKNNTYLNRTLYVQPATHTHCITSTIDTDVSLLSYICNTCFCRYYQYIYHINAI